MGTFERLPSVQVGSTTDQSESSGPGASEPKTEAPRVYPVWLVRIVPESVLHSLVPNAEKVARDDYVKAKHRIELGLTKLPLEDRLQLIEGVASIFQTSVPTDGGLITYAEALEELGRTPLREGARAIVRSHKWPRLPFPAEMLDACQPFQNIMQSVHTQIMRKIGEFK